MPACFSFFLDKIYEKYVLIKIYYKHSKYLWLVYINDFVSVEKWAFSTPRVPARALRAAISKIINVMLHCSLLSLLSVGNSITLRGWIDTTLGPGDTDLYMVWKLPDAQRRGLRGTCFARLSRLTIRRRIIEPNQYPRVRSGLVRV